MMTLFAGPKAPRRLLQLSVCAIAIGTLAACGGGEGESDRQADVLSESAASAGRWKLYSIRMYVPDALLLRFDSATGEMTFRKTIEKGPFHPITRQIAPGASERVEPGRYTVRVIPDRKGSFMIRTDTRSGRVWMLAFAIQAKIWMDLKAPTAPHDPGEIGKFEVALVPGLKGLAIVRTNTITGEVYIYHLRDQSKKWLEIDAGMGDLEAQRKPGLRQSEKPSGMVQEVPDMESIADVLRSDESPPEVRTIMVTLLGKHYPGDSKKVLLATLDDDDPQVLMSVIVALPAEGPDVVEGLKGLLSHPNPEVAKAARMKLTRIR